MTRRAVVCIVLCCGVGLLWGKPRQYLLWLATKDGKADERLADFLERKLTVVDIQLLKQSERYKQLPHLAMPVCTGAEYYLFSPAEDLLAVGCVDAAYPGLAVQAVADAMNRYTAEIRKGGDPTVLATRRRR